MEFYVRTKAGNTLTEEAPKEQLREELLEACERQVLNMSI